MAYTEDSSIAGIVRGAHTGSLFWVLFGILFLSNAIGGVVSTLMAVYLPVVVGDLAGNTLLDLDEIGAAISALYLLGWTLGGFSWGVISDRLGRLPSFMFSFGLVGVFTLLIAFVSSWEVVVVLRFFSGFCVGGVLVVTNAYLSEIWPKKSRGLILGILSIGFPVGIISAGMINLFFQNWRNGFLIGLIPLFLTLFSLWFLRELPDSTGKSTNRTTFLHLGNVFRENRDTLLKGSILFGSMLIGLWAVFSWLPTWVQSLVIGMDGQEQRSLSMMLLGIGGLSGGIISGWVARFLGLRRAMILCFAGCSIVAMVLFGLNRDFTPLIYAETALLALFFGISQGLLTIYIPQLFKSSLRGTATGFCYNTGRVFTTAAVFFIGALVNLFGGYSQALLAFSLVFVLGLVTLLFSSNLQLKT